MMKFDFVIIGAGIVGAATAHALSKRFPGKTIAIVEKETAVGVHQSNHNSGVIHAGIYYAPGSFKSTLCRQGLQATYKFCAENNIPTRCTGKLLVATNDVEQLRMQALASRAQNNGVESHLISQAELRELEPSIEGVAALLVEKTGIVDYKLVAEQLAANSGATLYFDAPVTAIHESSQTVEIVAGKHSVSGAQLIVCGGLQADRLAKLAGLTTGCEIIPFRGDFYVLPKKFETLFRHLIYPVPDPALPFLGVHITSHIDGSVSVGPSAMLALAREQYRKHALNLGDSLALAKSRSFWRLLARYPRASFKELTMAISRTQYARAVRRYCAEIEVSDLQRHRCGIRAQAVNEAGELVHDFWFEQTKRSLHVLNAPSPAATAAIPIGEFIVDKIS